MAAPVVSSVVPTSGPPAGGTAVTLTGTGFTGATSVRFAGQSATNLVVVSDTSITCRTPAATQDAVVTITVQTPGGIGTSGLIYTYTGSTGTSDVFPAFVPIYPPPPVGNAQTIPNFPPPTPPPIGAVPVGPLVGPAVAAAAVPPSTAGFPLIRYGSGSATVPAIANMFPAFTTVFHNPPIVFSNIFTDGVTPQAPPSTATTQNVPVGGWGPPQGPAFPPPSFTLPAMDVHTPPRTPPFDPPRAPPPAPPRTPPPAPRGSGASRTGRPRAPSA
jgi:hypothetical protein